MAINIVKESDSKSLQRKTHYKHLNHSWADDCGELNHKTRQPVRWVLNEQTQFIKQMCCGPSNWHNMHQQEEPWGQEEAADINIIIQPIAQKEPADHSRLIHTDARDGGHQKKHSRTSYKLERCELGLHLTGTLNK